MPLPPLNIVIVVSLSLSLPAKVADAIDAVGKTSPDAKRRILSGEINISKKQLKELSSGSAAEIESISADIVNDTFKKQLPAIKTHAEYFNPVDSIYTALKPLEMNIEKLSGTLSSNLPKITNKFDRAEVKLALKSNIDKLEALYKQL